MKQATLCLIPLVMLVGAAAAQTPLQDAMRRVRQSRNQQEVRAPTTLDRGRASPILKRHAEEHSAASGRLTEEERRNAHRRVKNMMRAIEDGDLRGFSRALSGDFAQDRSIFENALRKEAREQSNVQIQIFPNQVNAGGNTVTYRFSWNRQANDLRSGVSDGTKGSATFLLARDEELKVKRLQGPLPFGVRDRDLVNQAGGPRARRIDNGQPVSDHDMNGNGF